MTTLGTPALQLVIPAKAGIHRSVPYLVSELPPLEVEADAVPWYRDIRKEGLWRSLLFGI
jgi:hypothetical protein